MHVFNLDKAGLGPQAPCGENPGQDRGWRRHRCVLGAGQISPYHCHPHATEIYFCYTGGGKMRTPRETIDVVPACSSYPPGEVHNTPTDRRTLLFGCAMAPT